jgi:SRSO17 transposase
VQRQYSGTLGRIDNCQIATFLAYVTPARERVLLDRRLYMPEKSWMADPARCQQAGVPPELTFTTRPEQVKEMIEAARTAGVPFAWFTADEEFGQNPGLCAWLEQNRIPYVMAVPKNTRFTDPTETTVQLDQLAKRIRRNSWQRRACGMGSKGPRVYDWALLDSADLDHQYMIRRSIDNGELAFYHCYNPNQKGSTELVRVAGARWPIEECFATAKDETGLDQYSAPGTHGTDISLSPCSPTPSSPSPHTRQEKRGPTSKTARPKPQPSR